MAIVLSLLAITFSFLAIFRLIDRSTGLVATNLRVTASAKSLSSGAVNAPNMGSSGSGSVHRCGFGLKLTLMVVTGGLIGALQIRCFYARLVSQMIELPDVRW